MELQELIQRLAEAPTLPDLRGNAVGIHHDVQPPEAYVQPELVTRHAEGSSPAVVLISAPAAVGKSMLARHLAARTGNPLWDLGQFRVGSNFFTGTIAQAYGGAGYAQLEEALRTGSVTLIIDAADEALVRAGLGNFEEAFADFARLAAGGDRTHASGVVLGRPETLELAGVLLLEQGLDWALHEIEFFDEARSRELIAARYAALTGQSTAAGIEDFTDAVFARINSTLPPAERDWDSPELRSFLGYAPVLDALARLADVSGNPYAEAQRLTAEDEPASLWQLLHGVIWSICERERVKFTANFATEDPTREATGAASYAVDEQVRMLLEPTPDEALVLVPPGTPDAWVDELVTAARQQLREHPFLRLAGAQQQHNPLARFTNVAFRDFLAARALGHGSAETAASTATYYSDPGLNPSPLLVRMFVTDPPAVPVDSSTLGALVDSASTELSAARAMRIQVDERRPEIERIDENAPDAELESSELEVRVFESDQLLNEFFCRLEDRGAIRLVRQCRNVAINAPSVTLTLGAGMRDFNMWAPCFVRAGTVTIEAEDVRVTGHGDAVIDADLLLSSTAHVRLANDVTLALDVPDAPFPWHQYRVDHTGGAVTDQELMSAAMDLRGVLSWFLRRSIHGGFRYPRRAMDIIRRKQRTPEDMFQFCLARGLIVEDGQEYAFEAPFDISKLRNMDLADESLHAFLSDYVEARRESRS